MNGLMELLTNGSLNTIIKRHNKLEISKTFQLILSKKWGKTQNTIKRQMMSIQQDHPERVYQEPNWSSPMPNRELLSQLCIRVFYDVPIGNGAVAGKHMLISNYSFNERWSRRFVVGGHPIHGPDPCRAPSNCRPQKNCFNLQNIYVYIVYYQWDLSGTCCGQTTGLALRAYKTSSNVLCHVFIKWHTYSSSHYSVTTLLI